MVSGVNGQRYEHSMLSLSILILPLHEQFAVLESKRIGSGYREGWICLVFYVTPYGNS